MIPSSRPDIRKKDFRYISNILKIRQVAKGPQVLALEKAACGLTGTRYGVAVSSGTAALHLALLTLGVGKGDEVILPSYVCTALLYAVNYVGAKPVLVDVDPITLNPTNESIVRKIRSRTKAILVTHTFGFPQPVKELLKQGIPIIEDCTQALGASIEGKPAGSWGVIALFSLYATKLVCAGEGGVLCTPQRALAERARDLTTPDGQEKYRLRYNYKLSDLAAGLAVQQLLRFKQHVSRRRTLAKQYVGALGTFAPVQQAAPGTDPVYYRFVVRSDEAERSMRRAHAKGIFCDKPVFRPLHRYLSLSPSSFPGTEEAWRTSVSVPLYPALTKQEVSRIARALPAIFS